MMSEREQELEYVTYNRIYIYIYIYISTYKIIFPQNILRDNRVDFITLILSGLSATKMGGVGVGLNWFNIGMKIRQPKPHLINPCLFCRTARQSKAYFPALRFRYAE